MAAVAVAVAAAGVVLHGVWHILGLLGFCVFSPSAFSAQKAFLCFFCLCLWRFADVWLLDRWAWLVNPLGELCTCIKSAASLLLV
jgi:hypothetical protein